MKPQVVHETEIHRKHVRLNIPIRVEMDGARYKVEDWSVGGFGVENVFTSRHPGERFRVRVIFPFEDFELSIRADAQMVYVDRDHQRFGCRFLMLTAEQRDVFRYIADAAVSGEIITAGDLLHLPTRSAAAGRNRAAPSSEAELDEPPGRRARRYARPIALALAALMLLGLGAAALNEFYLTVRAASAVVDAPLHRLRAPIAGLFTSATESGRTVSRGEPLAVVRGFDGTVVPLESPCTCIVLDQVTRRGQYYQPGDPLITLVETGPPPRVRAQVAVDDAARLEVGDRATIRFPDRAGVLLGQIERIDLRPTLAALGTAGDGHLLVDHRLAQVLIRPDQPLAHDDVGTLVSVRFR